MNKKIFIIIILLIIYLVFIIVPFKELLIQLGKYNYYRTDNWKLVEKSSDPIYDKIMSLEANIENRYNNYFPFYESINSMFYTSIIKTNSLYLDDIYLKDNNDEDHIFYDKNNNFYYLVNKYSNKELTNRMNEQINFYNDINNEYPDINIAIYLPLRYEMTTFKNVNNINNYVNTFKVSLNNDIKLKIFDVNSTSEYLSYYYKTDHHYNSYGAEKAYLDIMEMYDLNNDLKIKHSIIKTPYYGSMAKSTLLKKQYDDLSAMQIYNDLKVDNVDNDFKPLVIKNKDNTFYDYYVSYFNGAYGEVIYHNNTSYNKNLLIFGDSMAWQIDYLLANSFDNTYVINTKYSPWTSNDLLLKDYIKDNKITHILFLRESKNTLFDADNFHIDKKVIR